MSTLKKACPACGFENEAGTLVCAQCHALLRKPEGDLFDSTLPASSPGPKPVARPGPLTMSDLPVLSAHALALYIGGRTKPLIVEIPRLAVLGRPSQDGSVQPDIDLTPYGGYEKGVSRRHALIRRTERSLMVEDLDSTNGTLLNGQPLRAYIAAPLKPKDRLTLGKLEMLVYFR